MLLDCKSLLRCIHLVLFAFARQLIKTISRKQQRAVAARQLCCCRCDKLIYTQRERAREQSHYTRHAFRLYNILMVRRENSYSARRVLLFIEQLAPCVCVCEYSSESGEAAAPFVTRPCAQSERERAYHPCSMQIFTLGRVNTSSRGGRTRQINSGPTLKRLSFNLNQCRCLLFLFDWREEHVG